MVEAWKAKDREGAVAAAPWELIEEMFIFGDARARCASGSTRSSRAASRCPVLTPITTPDKLGELIEALAPT